MRQEEVESVYDKALEDIENLEFKNMMSDEEDQLGVILTINSGAGGLKVATGFHADANVSPLG